MPKRAPFAPSRMAGDSGGRSADLEQSLASSNPVLRCQRHSPHDLARESEDVRIPGEHARAREPRRRNRERICVRIFAAGATPRLPLSRDAVHVVVNRAEIDQAHERLQVAAEGASQEPPRDQFRRVLSTQEGQGGPCINLLLWRWVRRSSLPHRVEVAEDRIAAIR